MSSVLVYGAAGLAAVDQATADRSVQLALDAGNHFHVAASYGEAALRPGPWLARLRDRVFLATKAERRDRDGAGLTLAMADNQVLSGGEAAVAEYMRDWEAPYLEAARGDDFIGGQT
jgi:aryl-alcohol dehydrogenase-like predicted oxidoreductase